MVRCAGVGNQITHMYHTGELDSCREAYESFASCLAIKYKSIGDMEEATRRLKASQLKESPAQESPGFTTCLVLVKCSTSRFEASFKVPGTARRRTCGKLIVALRHNSSHRLIRPRSFIARALPQPRV